MESRHLYAEIFRHAAAASGGVPELAQRLGVRAEDVHAWIEARATPPLDAFLDALDLIELSTT